MATCSCGRLVSLVSSLISCLALSAGAGWLGLGADSELEICANGCWLVSDGFIAAEEDAPRNSFRRNQRNGDRDAILLYQLEQDEQGKKRKNKGSGSSLSSRSWPAAVLIRRLIY